MMTPLVRRSDGASPALSSIHREGAPPVATATSEAFGTTLDGRAVDRLSLANEHLALDVLTWGAAIQGLRLLRDDVDVVLGYPALDCYETDPWFLGAVVGRYANRIAGGGFALDGVRH